MRNREWRESAVVETKLGLVAAQGVAHSVHNIPLSLSADILGLIYRRKISPKAKEWVDQRRIAEPCELTKINRHTAMERIREGIFRLLVIDAVIESELVAQLARE